MTEPLTPAPRPHDTQALADRIENHYDFQCEGGPLRNCREWQQLRAAMRGDAAPAKDASSIGGRCQGVFNGDIGCEREHGHSGACGWATLPESAAVTPPVATEGDAP